MPSSASRGSIFWWSKMWVLGAMYQSRDGPIRLGRALTTSFGSTRWSRTTSSSLYFSTSKDSILPHRRKRPKPNLDGLYKKLHPREWKMYQVQLKEWNELRASYSDLEEETTTTTASGNEVIFPLVGRNLNDAPPRTRFAPSPTGSLHVGGARTALYNWLLAQKAGGDAAFVLRVEDTDQARSTIESEQSVVSDLKWLGLHWDEGPSTEDEAMGSYGPYRQSERTDIYQQVAQRLLDEGKAYRCFCTKEELEAMAERQREAGEVVRYDGTWRDADPVLVQEKLDNGDDYTVRFRVPPGARVVIEDAVRGTVAWDADATVGDFILLRSGGSLPVYNFCVAVDDAAMGITTVVRAEEHLTNTLRQALVLDALGVPRPRYAHCSLILGEDRQKLSKRHGATSCRQFMLDGYLPDAMVNYLALLGWNDGSEDEIFSRQDLVEAFDLERVVKSPSVFDMEKLNWVNAQHLKRMSIEEVTPLVTQQLRLLDVIPAEDEIEGEQARQNIQLLATACTCLAKQMMETTRRAGTNAIAVMDYPLPASFEEDSSLEGMEEAKAMIKMGHFYGLASRLVTAYEAGELPLPDPENPMDAFTDQSNQQQKKLIGDDDQTGGGAYSYPAAYKAFMKSMAKEFGVKGKNLFHPVRYALTGRMSGQDVTKQLTLVDLALKLQNTDEEPVVRSHVQVVGLDQRIARLKAYLETVPSEHRTPPTLSSANNKMDTSSTPNAAQNGNAQRESTSQEAPPPPAFVYDGPPIEALDIRVGTILKAWEHPESDKLWCEEIDVGEETPRNVASGIRAYYKDASELVGRKVLVVCNLKERKLAGFPSHGMVLCASSSVEEGDDEGVDVKIIAAPADAIVGERVIVPRWNNEENADSDEFPYKENKVAKKKVFEKIAPHLKTDEYGTPGFLGIPFVSTGGVCSTPISNGSVS